MPQSFTLSYPAEDFDLPLCVSSGQTFRWRELGDQRWLGVDRDRWYRVSLPSADSASSDDSAVKEKLTAKHAEDAERMPAESNGSREDFERLFRLDQNGAEIKRKIIERGRELAPFIEQLPGLRIMRCSDPNEVLFTFMCTANNHLKRIGQMVGKLAAHGEQIDEVEGQPIHRFPSAEVFAQIPEGALRAKGFGYRGRSIPTAARQIAAKPEGWLEDLKRADYKSAHAELCAIHGIGPKLADCIALFGLHHMQAVPIDTHIWQAACRLYFPDWRGKPLTAARYREFGDFFRDRFGDLAGWAHQYLFYENLLNWRSRR